MNIVKLFALVAIVAATVGLGACAKKEAPAPMQSAPATYGYSK